MELIFKILCGILYLIGLVFGYDYKEISVYICIYACPILCIFSASITNFILIYKLAKNSSLFKWFLWFLSFLQIYSFICFYSLVYEYYQLKFLSINDIFNCCMQDLQQIANTCHTTYEHVNIVIYVYLFFGILIFNTIITYLIKKKL